MSGKSVKILAPRLMASCKDRLFSAVMDRYGQSDFREDVQISNDLYILYREFKALADYIARRAPRISLSPLEIIPLDSTMTSPEDYAKTFSEHIDIEDDKLQFLTRTILKSHFLHDNTTRATTAPDYTRLLLIDPARLIRKSITDNGDPVYGFALYITPPGCHRLVFFSAGTELQSRYFRVQAKRPDFDWEPYSKSYAIWRLKNVPV